MENQLLLNVLGRLQDSRSAISIKKIFRANGQDTNNPDVQTEIAAIENFLLRNALIRPDPTTSGFFITEKGTVALNAGDVISFLNNEAAKQSNDEKLNEINSKLAAVQLSYHERLYKDYRLTQCILIIGTILAFGSLVVSIFSLIQGCK